MAAFFHPSSKRLSAWLETGASAEVDDHLRHCERCATKLEQISGVLPSLGDALRRVLAVPADLEDRVAAAVAARAHGRAELELLSEMFTLPADTLRALSPDPEGGE